MAGRPSRLAWLASVKRTSGENCAAPCREGAKTVAEEHRIVILVVAETEADRRVMGRAMADAGFDVREADSGAAALRKAQDLPDLILLDVNLPDIDGLEVCRRLKAAPDTCHIPVLQLSATRADLSDRVRALESGADGRLALPLAAEELIAAVRSLLRTGSLAQAAASFTADALWHRQR